MRNVGSTIVNLSEQSNRVPISKIEFDVSGLSEEELLDTVKLTFEEFTQDGGTGAANGFLFGSHDENQTEYANSSCLGVFDYDITPDGDVILLGAMSFSSTQWQAKIKRITDPTDTSQWSWDGATVIGPYDGDVPRSCMVWYVGGVDDEVGALFAGGGEDACWTSKNCGLGYIGYSVLKVGDDVYFGGKFTQGLGVSIAYGIVRYDTVGEEAHAVGGGISGFPPGFTPLMGSYSYITDMVQTSDGKIYVGGFFGMLDGVISSSCVGWYDPDTKEWYDMDGGVSQSGNDDGEYPLVYRLAVDSSDNIWVIGDFYTAGELVSPYIAIWSHIEQRWLLQNSTQVVNGVVYDISMIEDIAYICGDFSYDGSKNVLYGLAKRTLSGNLEALSPQEIYPTPHLIASDGDDIYMGAWTTWINPDSIIYKYDSDTQSWNSIGAANDHINRMRFESNGNLYIGGDQTLIDAVNVRGLGYWDGANWHELDATLTNNEVIGWAYENADSIWLAGYWWLINGIGSYNAGYWNGVDYDGVRGASTNLFFAKFTSYTTLNGAMLTGSASYPSNVIREIKPASKNTGAFTTYQGALISIGGGCYLGQALISGGTTVVEQLFRHVGVYAEYPECCGVQVSDDAGFYLYLVGSLGYDLSISKIYSVHVDFSVDVSSPELVKSFSGDITSLNIAKDIATYATEKLYIIVERDGEVYIDSTGVENSIYCSLFVLENTSSPLVDETTYKTKYGGLGNPLGTPGTIPIVCDDILYTIGGFGHGTTSPYGPYFIQKLVETDLLAISDDILSWTLSHSGPNTAAQLSLEVANANGKWNDSIVFHLGSTLILYAGYNDGTDDHYAEIARFTISSINNQIKMGEQQIDIEANDYLTQLSQTQASALQQYSSQLINTVNFYYSNPFTERELVSIRGQWAYQSNVQIKAANLSDSSSDEAKHPVVYMAETGATVGDVDIEFSMYMSSKDRGLGGVIVAGNPSDLEDGSLVVLARARDTYISIYIAVLKKTDNIAPLSLEEGHLFSSLGSMTLSTAPQKWIYYRVRKQGSGIYVWWGTDGVNYTYLSSKSVGFSPQWYKDNDNRGHVGLYAAPYRDNSHSNREVYFRQFNSYSLEKSQTVANIMRSIITNAYSSIDVVDTVSGFEKRFEDNFADGVFDSAKWRFATSAYIATNSVVVDSGASNGYALKLTTNGGQWGRVNYEMTGHNRCFTVRAKMSNHLAISVRCAASPGPSEFSRGYTFFLRRDANWVWASKHSSTGSWSHVRSLDPIPTIGTGYHIYTITTLGKWISLWIDGSLAITIEDTNSFNPATSTITEYYGVGTADIAWIDYIKNDSLDTVITGLDGIIGFTINPGDFYNTKMEELADTCAGLYFMRGNTFIAGELVPPADSVDVFDSGDPYEFKDNLFQYGNEISSEDWYTAVQVIDAEGNQGPLIVDPDADSFSYKKTYIHFAEGVTDSSELWDIGQHILEEKKRNRRRESFKGFGQLALELRDRANIQVHRVPTDDSSALDIDISRLVNSYTLAFSRGDGPDLSLDVELVE